MVASKLGAVITPMEASLEALLLHKELVTMQVMIGDQFNVDPAFCSLQTLKCFLDTTGIVVEQMNLRWVEGNKIYVVYVAHVCGWLTLVGPVWTLWSPVTLGEDWF